MTFEMTFEMTFDIQQLRAKRTFCPVNAQQLAGAAQLAYESSELVAERLGRDDISSVCFDVRDTQGFVAAGEHAAVLAFRGTESNSLADWVTDADLTLVDGPLGGRVHEGFYDALSHVWRTIDDAVAGLATDKPLWITGHSLGGALAVLAAARWLDADRPLAGLYTFGQPRVGDATFARNFNFAMKTTAFRVVNDNDLVTRMPPRSLGYSHTATFLCFTEDGRLVEDIQWWRDFLSRWTGRILDVVRHGDVGLDDHRMDNYSELINGLARRGRAASWRAFGRAA
ncbi:MAG: lipase family protein [Pirellulaceae bacterium]|jgi:triacylglycerol lipase|nr:lipase family protein [Pirellulaceae bacterium]